MIELKVKQNLQFYLSVGVLLLSFLLIGVLPKVTLETEVVNPDFEVIGIIIMIIFLTMLWINGYYFHKLKEGK